MSRKIHKLDRLISFSRLIKPEKSADDNSACGNNAYISTSKIVNYQFYETNSFVTVGFERWSRTKVSKTCGIYECLVPSYTCAMDVTPDVTKIWDNSLSRPALKKLSPMPDMFCNNQCTFQICFNQMCVSGCECCNNQCAFQTWTFVSIKCALLAMNVVTINVRVRGERFVSIKCAFLGVNDVTINVRFRGERLVSIKCAFLAVNVSLYSMCVSPTYFLCSTKLWIT